MASPDYKGKKEMKKAIKPIPPISICQEYDAKLLIRKETLPFMKKERRRVSLIYRSHNCGP